MLDACGYKATAEDTKQFESLAREIFKEEIGQGNLDALIGHDQNGNLWIYASEEAKQYAESQSISPIAPSSPPEQPTPPILKALTQISSDEQQEGLISRAESEPAIPTVDKSKQDEGYSYAKTLRLTSDQLVSSLRSFGLIEKSLNLQPGKNSLSFSVTSSFAGKARCTAHMYYWKYDVPVVISDIDGTITKFVL